MTLPVWQGLAAREENTDIVVLASPTVTVTNEATGGQPSLFSDRAGTNPLGNPFTANADGSIEFYVAPGRYGIEATKGGNTVTWDNQLLGVGVGGERIIEDAVTVSGNASSPTDDVYQAAFGRDVSARDVVLGDFTNPNDGTTPTLENTSGTPGALTITTKDGSALWAGALSGLHSLQLNAGGTAWLCRDPNPVSANSANAPVARDANGRAKFADPSAAQDAATKTYADGLVADVVDAVTDTDTLTWHEQNDLSLGAGVYSDVFDLTGAVELLGGTIYSQSAGFRLTVDGTVVANRTAQVFGKDDGSDAFSVVSLPQAKAASSMKLEAYNASGVTRVFGWRAVTR